MSTPTLFPEGHVPQERVLCADHRRGKQLLHTLGGPGVRSIGVEDVDAVPESAGRVITLNINCQQLFIARV